MANHLCKWIWWSYYINHTVSGRGEVAQTYYNGSWNKVTPALPWSLRSRNDIKAVKHRWEYKSEKDQNIKTLLLLGRPGVSALYSGSDSYKTRKNAELDCAAVPCDGQIDRKNKKKYNLRLEIWLVKVLGVVPEDLNKHLKSIRETE